MVRVDFGVAACLLCGLPKIQVLFWTPMVVQGRPGSEKSKSKTRSYGMEDLRWDHDWALLSNARQIWRGKCSGNWNLRS